MKKIITLFILLVTLTASAQVGDYRNRFCVGMNGGYVINSVGFQPAIMQKMKGGTTFGLTGRYTSEKYFSMICSIQAEVNFTMSGWQEDIRTYYGNPVINPLTGVAESSKRDLTYVQVPLLAHLAFGKEQKGVNFFIDLGPQIGFLLSDKASKNFSVPFTQENFPNEFTTQTGRMKQVNVPVNGKEVNIAEHLEGMKVENKLDYGICFGLGIEAHFPKVGRFFIDGRYYYGLGNLFGDSKKDAFSKSNNGMIYARMGYLYEIPQKK